MHLPHPSVVERLDRLAPDQRAAATAPPGPILCVAPAGSGKTTTLVARVAWLVGGGSDGPVDPATITILAFNRRAAEELSDRLDAALAPLGAAPGAVRVRTFHALGLDVLREAGQPTAPVLDRDALLRRLFPDRGAAERTALDLAFSRLKLDLRVRVEDVAADAERGPLGDAFLAYERAIAGEGGLDFDDLVSRALTLLDENANVRATWRRRAAHLLVDEAQDLDRSQLALALLLAAPANDIFLVGDDDQTIYGWRLADVRRILALHESLPGLRRVDLTTNYRCPAVVVSRAVRLVEVNRERFAKRIVAGPRATGRLVLAPDPGDETERVGRVMRSWPADETTRAILARTNRELLPAVVVALEMGVPFRAPALPLLLEDPRIDHLLDEVAATPPSWPLLVRIGRVRAQASRAATFPTGPPDPDAAPPLPDGDGPADAMTVDDLLASLLGWATPHPDLATLRTAVDDRRERLTELRRDDATLSLATAHATKGAEWDHVAVLMDGFPARRAVATAPDPVRVLEEERRLAYVAWTRARRSLTLVYDPTAPSPFLLEAFDPDELGLDPDADAQAA